MSVTSQSVKQADFITVSRSRLFVFYLYLYLACLYNKQTNKQTNQRAWRVPFKLSGLSWSLVASTFTGFLGRPTDCPGGGLLHKKNGNARLRDTKILFCGRGLPESFSPPRGTNSYITNYLLSRFFCSIPERNVTNVTQISSCGSFEAENLRRNQNCFFDP